VLLAAVKELGANNPKIGDILGTSGKRIGGTVKDITNHYLQHERHCSSTEYFYWPWEWLEDDDREHTGSKCKPCQESNYQAAVYGMEGVDKHNNPIKNAGKRELHDANLRQKVSLVG
jgi:hypothetical protein